MLSTVVIQAKLCPQYPFLSYKVSKCGFLSNEREKSDSPYSVGIIVRVGPHFLNGDLSKAVFQT